MPNDTTTDKKPQVCNINDFLQKSRTKRSDIDRAVMLAENVMKETRISSMANCGNFLTFLHDKEFSTTKLETGFFCENRLCPGCAWRKAAHDAVEISCILQAAVDDGNELYFATLTAESVPGDQLTQAVRDYSNSYTEMMRRVGTASIAGTIRKIEITYNPKENWYHPHIHSVWIVPKGWARTKKYISAERLADMWRKSLQGKYAVSAAAQDVRRVRTARKEDILEFSKYPAKSGDYLYNAETFKTFYHALRGTRLITFLRKARELKRAYKHGLLDGYKEPDLTEYYYRSMWLWSRESRQYALHELQTLENPMIFGTKDTDESGGDESANAPDH